MNNGTTQINLDRLAAKHAQAVIRRTVDEGRKKPGDVENTVTKTLGVLQENGVYACVLYLLSRKQEKGSVEVVDEIMNLLDGLGFDWGKPASDNTGAILSHISDKVTVNLERLLLAKETLEQMLIYARYGAKAR